MNSFLMVPGTSAFFTFMQEQTAVHDFKVWFSFMVNWTHLLLMVFGFLCFYTVSKK